MLLSPTSSQIGQYGSVGDALGEDDGGIVGLAVVGLAVGCGVGSAVISPAVILGGLSVRSNPRT